MPKEMLARAETEPPQWSPVIDALIGANYSTNLIRQLVEWGITAGNWTAGGAANEYTQNAGLTMLNMERFRWIVAEEEERAIIVETADDLERAAQERIFGLIIGFQGAEPLGSEFHYLSIFARLGLRILGLTYNNRNLLGDGCLEPENRGLTHYGIEIVRECNRLGVVVDLSHVGERSSYDAIDHSAHPCIFSHSNLSSFHANPRNVSDDLARQLAERGGVVGLAAWSNFVGPVDDGQHPTRSDYVRLIDHVVGVVGIDHVGIGTDIYIGMDHAAEWNSTTKRRYPEQCGEQTWERHNIADFADNSAILSVADELLHLGYSVADVAKVMGGNFDRVFTQIFPRSKQPSTALV